MPDFEPQNVVNHDPLNLFPAEEELAPRHRSAGHDYLQHLREDVAAAPPPPTDAVTDAIGAGLDPGAAVGAYGGMYDHQEASEGPAPVPRALDAANNAYGMVTAGAGDLAEAGTIVKSADTVWSPIAGTIGALTMLKGIVGAERGGDDSQAALDVGAGAVGMVAPFLAEMIPGINIIAAGAGLAASGNELAEKERWYGEHEEGGTMVGDTFGGSVERTYDTVAHDVGGNGGKLVGGLAAAGKAVANGVVAMGAGALDTSNAIVEGILGGPHEKRAPTAAEQAADAELAARKAWEREHPDAAAMQRKLYDPGVAPTPEEAAGQAVVAAGRAWEATYGARYDALKAKLVQASNAREEATYRAELATIPEDPRQASAIPGG